MSVECGEAQRGTSREKRRRRRTRRRHHERYEPVLQVAEIMLTLVTVKDPPLPEVLEADGDDEADALGAAELSVAAPPAPAMRPVTIIW